MLLVRHFNLSEGNVFQVLTLPRSRRRVGTSPVKRRGGGLYCTKPEQPPGAAFVNCAVPLVYFGPGCCSDELKTERLRY